MSFSVPSPSKVPHMARSDDRFANIASAEVSTTAADALTFTEVLTGISLGVGRGIIIDEVDYYPNVAMYRELDADADSFICGWTTSNAVTDLSDVSDRRILHTFIAQGHLIGTAATLNVYHTPAVFQFFPPIIVATPRLYLACDTVGFGATALLRSRLFFRFIDLSPQEYLEIAETFQLTS